MNKGLVIKYNSSQRYNSNCRTSGFIKCLAEKHSIPLQEFMVRNDSTCGGTIGPMMSAQLGIQGVDVGVAQLSMHSIRETAGIEDMKHSIDLFRAFFESQDSLTCMRTLDQCDVARSTRNKK